MRIFHDPSFDLTVGRLQAEVQTNKAVYAAYAAPRKPKSESVAESADQMASTFVLTY